MAKGNRRFGPADQAVVITFLLDGATVAQAARKAGFAVQTLYADRRRCALFARAWADAVAESARPRLVAMGTGGWWQLKRLRRNRFTRERKELFLGQLAATCDVAAAAEAAGVCRATVYSHRESDAAFAAAWREALEMGVAMLEARLLEQQSKALEGVEFEVAAEPPAAAAQERDLDFWRSLHLLREHKYGLSGGRKAGRPPGRAPEAQVAASIHRLLGTFRRREERNRKWGTPDCRG